MQLHGKVAVVTGGSRGIGRATALLLAGRGATVYATYRQSRAAAEEVAAAGGGRVRILQADMEQREDIERVFETVAREQGGLDILVYSAAATAFKPMLEQKPHNLQRTFQLTVFGFVAAAQAAAPLMQGRKGKIVAVSGLDANRVLPRHGVLGAAKASLEALVRYMGAELAPMGINVNGVNPGYVETDSFRYYAGEKAAAMREAIGRFTPMGRLAEPEEIARVVAFLCSDDAAWICGHTVVADGGLTLIQGPVM